MKLLKCPRYEICGIATNKKNKKDPTKSIAKKYDRHDRIFLLDTFHIQYRFVSAQNGNRRPIRFSKPYRSLALIALYTTLALLTIGKKSEPQIKMMKKIIHYFSHCIIIFCVREPAFK